VLDGGGGAVTNVAVQLVCPNDVVDHIGGGAYDNTAYQLAVDALTHRQYACIGRHRPGHLPADPGRAAAGLLCDCQLQGSSQAFAQSSAGSGYSDRQPP
jgi:hypothetical protein